MKVPVTLALAALLGAGSAFADPLGHALELGRPGVPVAWNHDGHAYHFTPRGDARGGCRYATMVIDGRKPHEVLACPSGRGEWTFRRS